MRCSSVAKTVKETPILRGIPALSVGSPSVRFVGFNLSI